jgi:hypothetical protein
MTQEKKDPGKVNPFIASAVGLKKDDHVWEEWLELEDPDNSSGYTSNLIDLLRSKVRIEFKMRAVAILLVPFRYCIPFKLNSEWNGAIREDGNTLLDLWKNFFKRFNITGELLTFTADLIHHCILEVKDIPKKVRGYDVSLYYYNDYIIQLLGILPEDDPVAEKLFSVYQLFGPHIIHADGNRDLHYSYHPFFEILIANIPEKWKRLAISRMHTIIEEEESGLREPPSEDGHAVRTLKAYAGEISRQICAYQKIFYSTELFVFQLRFILGLSQIQNLGLFPSYDIHRILKIITHRRYKPLRYRLARYVVLENTTDNTKFKVYSKETKSAAKVMLAEFGDDSQIASVLSSLLDQYHEVEKTKKHAVLQVKAKKQGVIGRMT